MIRSYRPPVVAAVKPPIPPTLKVKPGVSRVIASRLIKNCAPEVLLFPRFVIKKSPEVVTLRLKATFVALLFVLLVIEIEVAVRSAWAVKFSESKTVKLFFNVTEP